jgi:hypothetical protein
MRRPGDCLLWGEACGGPSDAVFGDGQCADDATDVAAAFNSLFGLAHHPGAAGPGWPWPASCPTHLYTHRVRTSMKPRASATASSPLVASTSRVKIRPGVTFVCRSPIPPMPSSHASRL